MIFVTVGTHEQQFDRLVRCVDRLKAEGKITEEVMIQTGFSSYEPKACKWSKLCSYQEMNEYMDQARIVITHGGPSSIMMALQRGKIPIVVPRQKRYEEHVNDHQVEFSRFIKEKQKNIIVVEEIDTLDFSIIKAFNNVNKPILGICRGIQAINVCFGGSLYQDIPYHKLPKEERHNIKFEKASFLYNCYNTEQMLINSLHHQAIKELAKGFKAVAKSEDGIVEAIENKNIIAVQWHPEYMNDTKFFEYFINKICNKDH